MTKPNEPGHYWGRWHSPDPQTADSGEMCCGELWEVHRVYRDDVGNEPDLLRVFVPGVEATQPIDAFEWGNRVPNHTG